MTELRTLFSALGFANVTTFIASGNVIFEASTATASELEPLIEAHLRQALGYAVATFLRTTSAVATIAAYQPFPALPTAPGASLIVGFLHDQPNAESQQKLLALSTDLNEFHFHQRELYWLCHTRLSDSTISGTVLEKTLGVQTTLRNTTTVRKIAAQYGIE